MKTFAEKKFPNRKSRNEKSRLLCQATGASLLETVPQPRKGFQTMIAFRSSASKRKYVTEEMIDRFCQRHPRVRVRVGSGHSVRIVSMPVDNIGLIYHGRRVLADNPAMIAPPPEPNQVRMLVDLLRAHPHRPTKQPTWHSYGLKHALEKALGAYCANGGMIVALDRIGAQQRQMQLNTEVYISRLWLRQFEGMAHGAWSCFQMEGASHECV